MHIIKTVLLNTHFHIKISNYGNILCLCGRGLCLIKAQWSIYFEEEKNSFRPTDASNLISIENHFSNIQFGFNSRSEILNI